MTFNQLTAIKSVTGGESENGGLLFVDHSHNDYGVSYGYLSAPLSSEYQNQTTVITTLSGGT